MALGCSEMDKEKQLNARLSNYGLISRTWIIFPSTRDSKLARDGLGLQGNRQGKNYWTLGFELTDLCSVKGVPTT